MMVITKMILRMSERKSNYISLKLKHSHLHPLVRAALLVLQKEFLNLVFTILKFFQQQ
mgnify:CR=1 FL=1